MDKTKHTPDPLESFVSNNREDFDIHTPDPASWDRISQSIDQPSGKKSVVRIMVRLTAAAAMLIFAITSLIWVLDSRNSPAESSHRSYRLQDISPEMAEVEFYYTSKVNYALAELDKTGRGDDVRHELELLEEEYNALQLEMGADHDSEKVIQAMINNYRLRLDLLEKVLQNIHNTKTTQSDEEDNTIEI